jgi:hypothetical protein
MQRLQAPELSKLRATASLALLAAAAVWLAPAPARAADVGVSVQISQPGVYGRVDIGRFPQPEVYVQQPVIVQRVRAAPQPVYMWVPPGHRKNWSRHCGRYNACGVPVYFVRDTWYDQRVRHHDRPDDRRDGGPPGRGHGKDRAHGGPPGHDRDHGPGRGRGPRD